MKAEGFSSKRRMKSRKKDLLTEYELEGNRDIKWDNDLRTSDVAEVSVLLIIGGRQCSTPLCVGRRRSVGSRSTHTPLSSLSSRCFLTVIFCILVNRCRIICDYRFPPRFHTVSCYLGRTRASDSELILPLPVDP